MRDDGPTSCGEWPNGHLDGGGEITDRFYIAKTQPETVARARGGGGGLTGYLAWTEIRPGPQCGERRGWRDIGGRDNGV